MRLKKEEVGNSQKERPKRCTFTLKRGGFTITSIKAEIRFSEDSQLFHTLMFSPNEKEATYPSAISVKRISFIYI